MTTKHDMERLVAIIDSMLAAFIACDIWLFADCIAEYKRFKEEHKWL